MLVGITTNGKIGLAVMALVFIGFALLASFVFPRRNPDFPGDRLRGFVWVTVLLFVAMMAAVFVLAREAEGEEHVVEEEVAIETTETGDTDRRDRSLRRRDGAGGDDRDRADGNDRDGACGDRDRTA